MRARLACASGVLLACCALAGCAGRNAAPANSAQSVAGTKTRCVTPDERGRWREMTWEEYYADVRERAWRNNAIVIWIIPPEVHKRPPANATACAR